MGLTELPLRPSSPRQMHQPFLPCLQPGQLFGFPSSTGLTPAVTAQDWNPRGTLRPPLRKNEVAKGWLLDAQEMSMSLFPKEQGTNHALGVVCKLSHS